MSIYSVIFIGFSILQTLNNLEIYAGGLWHILYLWIGVLSIVFILVYNLRGNKVLETGVALFIVHSFKIFDRDMVSGDFIWVHALVFLILLYLLIGMYNKTIQPPKKSLFNASLLLFAGTGLISTLRSICVYSALQQYLVLLDFLIVTFIIANYFTEDKQIRFLVNIFFIIAMILIGLVLFKSGGLNFCKLLSNRIEAEWIHPNSIAGYLNTVILLIMPICLISKKIIIKILYVLSIVILIVFSLLTFSRLGFFSLIFCFVLYLALIYKKRQLYAPEIRLTAGIILLLFSVLLIPQVNFSLVTRILDKVSDSANFYNCLVTLKAIKNNLFFGVGLGNNYFLANYGDIPFLNSWGKNLHIREIQSLLRSSPHSLFLGITYGLGIFGLIAFIAVIFIAIKSAWPAINPKEDSYQSRIAMGCFLAIISILMHGMLSMTFHFTIWPVVFWIMIGIIVAINLKTENVTLSVNRFVLKMLILSIFLLQVFIVIFPVYSGIFYKSGVLHAKKGDTEKAVKDIEKAILLNPINPDYFSYLENIYFKNDKKEEAISINKKLIKLKRYYAPYYFRLGVLYSDSALYLAAIENFRKAIELDKFVSQKESYYSKLIVLYFNMGLFQEASDLYKDTLKIIPYPKDNRYVKELGI